jgi:hypothetical protein
VAAILVATANAADVKVKLVAIIKYLFSYIFNKVVSV